MSLRVKRPLELDYTLVLLRALPPWKTLRYVRHVPLTIFYWRDSKMASSNQQLLVCWQTLQHIIPSSWPPKIVNYKFNAKFRCCLFITFTCPNIPASPSPASLRPCTPASPCPCVLVSPRPHLHVFLLSLAHYKCTRFVCSHFPFALLHWNLLFFVELLFRVLMKITIYSTN